MLKLTIAVCVAIFTLFGGEGKCANAFNIISKLENLKVDCQDCHSLTKNLNETLSDQNVLTKIKDVTERFFSNKFFMHHPSFRATNLKRVRAIAWAFKLFVATKLGQEDLCKYVIQCDNKFKLDVIKQHSLKLGIDFGLIFGRIDRELTAKLLALIVDKNTGMKLLLEKFCMDLRDKQKESLVVTKKIDEWCNFSESGVLCSLCNIMGEIVSSSITEVYQLLEPTVSKECGKLINNPTCNFLIGDLTHNLIRGALIAVNNGFACYRFGVCELDIFTRRCSKLTGLSNVACLITNMYESSANKSWISYLQKEKAATKGEAFNFCSAKFGDLVLLATKEKEAIRQYMNGVCKFFNGEFKQACNYLFDKKYDQLFEDLSGYLGSNSLCCTLDFCSAAQRNATRQKGYYVTCNSCNVGLTIARQKLRDPNMKEQMTEKLKIYLKSIVKLDFLIDAIIPYFQHAYVSSASKLHPKEFCNFVAPCQSSL